MPGSAMKSRIAVLGYVSLIELRFLSVFAMDFSKQYFTFFQLITEMFAFDLDAVKKIIPLVNRYFLG